MVELKSVELEAEKAEIRMNIVRLTGYKLDNFDQCMAYVTCLLKTLVQHYDMGPLCSIFLCW